MLRTPAESSASCSDSACEYGTSESVVPCTVTVVTPTGGLLLLLLLLLLPPPPPAFLMYSIGEHVCLRGWWKECERTIRRDEHSSFESIHAVQPAYAPELPALRTLVL